MKLIFCLLALFFSNLSSAKEWVFDAILNDELIGQHTFIYEDDRTISKANFKFEFLLMDFIYQHNSIETWDKNCLKSISSKTNDDGDLYQVTGQIVADGFLISSNQEETLLPQCIMTFAYGNSEILNQKKLMNSQNGEFLDVDVELIREENFILKGEKILTNLWQISAESNNGDILIYLWYDKDMQWVGLKTSTPIGDMYYQLR
tara:strand:+ start:401 stop:1012 length:612 start_codon:yes stop_codon:yes gene_type:complete